MSFSGFFPRALPAAAGEARTSASGLETEVAALHQEFSSLLYRFALSITEDRDAAVEAAQEVFTRYFFTRLAGNEVSDPRAWLIRTLRQYLEESRRSLESRQEVQAEEAAHIADRTNNPEAEMGREDLLERLRRVLTPRELECMRLRTLGLSYAEIGEALEISGGTVAALISRAVRKIRGLSPKF